MSFGTYTAVVANSTSTVSVTCTNTTPYTVALDAGLATGATVTNRSMKGTGSALLGYTLYSDTGRSVNFATTASITGNGAAQPITIYGQIPANEYVAPGSYTDTITATVTY
jgi:spore coat protein U-like protein